jgi:hypothetical protein
MVIIKSLNKTGVPLTVSAKSDSPLPYTPYASEDRVSCPLTTAENVTLIDPEPMISKPLLNEARPVEVSKPAVFKGIDPVALLEPVKSGADAAPAPVAHPPGTGTSVVLAVLDIPELY